MDVTSVHSQAGKQTVTIVLLANLGGILMRRFLIWPAATASKYSLMRSIYQEPINALPGSKIGQADAMNWLRLMRSVVKALDILASISGSLELLAITDGSISSSGSMPDSGIS